MFLLLVLPLTAILVPSTSSQASCGDGAQLEESDIADILDSINNKRKELAKGELTVGGNTFPNAKLMNKLVWDCDLEKTAIDKLKNQCSSPLTPPSVDGENTGLYYDDDDWNGYHIKYVAPNVWANVEDSWPDTLPTDTGSEVKMPADTKFKNFANLMRADTQKIGCAELPCPDDDGYPLLVFCLTNKAPLNAGETIYTVGPMCAKDEDCPNSPNTHCDTDTGLCEPPQTTLASTTTTPMSTTATTTAATSTAATTTAATTIAATTTAATSTAKETTTTAKDTTTTEISYPGELPTDTGANTMCKEHEGMTDELRMHFLDTQNYRRSLLATGQVARPSGNNLPNATDMIKLKLNCDLEKEAIHEVRQCPPSKVSHDKYGKNFNTFASSTATSTYRDAIKKAVTNWWKVVRTETTGPGMKVIFRSTHVGKPIESFTQIGWAATREIGCAIAKCSSSYTVICLYNPKGNIEEQPMYQRGTPCAPCPSGTTCDKALGLCVQN